jgi:FkbM family methyltransferase
MLIPVYTLVSELLSRRIKVSGVLHIGAHTCEELPMYNQLGVSSENIIWVDAIHTNVMRARERGIPNVYTAVITDKDDDTVMFNISNNVQSSSVLEFGTHAKEHPNVVYVDSVEMTTKTVDTFLDSLKMDCSGLNFWNIDIQGAELLALKGASKYLQNVDVLYLEVNTKELYKGCPLVSELDDFLAEHKFVRIVTQITRHGWGDALYVKNRPEMMQPEESSEE